MGPHHVLFNFLYLHDGVREPLDPSSGSEIGGVYVAFAG